MSVTYESFEVPVSGGSITAGRWGTGDQIVLASHGITANLFSWQSIGEHVVEQSAGATSIVAVDHRGRGGSADTPGPFGLATHANDLMSVLDHLDLDSAVLTGHSLGGFIVSKAAELHPDRVERLVLVDGGLPFPGPIRTDVDVETIVQSVIGPALDRLDQRWPDEHSYVEFFKSHPAFQPPNEWTAAAEAYVRHDAVRTPEGEIRSSVNKEAVLIDGGEAIVDPNSAAAIERVATPTMLVWAPRGLFDESPGLYTADSMSEARTRLPHLETMLATNTNHYTIAVGNHGASEVAGAIIDATGSPR